MREVFKEFFHNTLRSVKFQGTVKLDTPLFGRRDEFHKGNPNSYYYSIVSFSDFLKGCSDFSVQCIPFYHLLSNMASRRREIYEQWVWCKMQNIIGLAKEWPFLIRRLFWTRLASWQRILIRALVYLDGLDLLMFMELVTLKGLTRNPSTFNHFIVLFR